MKTLTQTMLVALPLWLGAPAIHAQNYSIDWYRIGGGGASAGGQYSLSGAIGQPDAGAMGGGRYSLSGGFLSIGPTAPTPPSIASVTPATGLTNGGTTVTLVGTGFASGATVSFGALPALSVEVVNSTELTAVTPPSALGTVSVVVSNADGQGATLSNGFTYVGPSGTPPFIVSQPASQVVGLGQMAQFSVTATGTAPLGYQWQANGANLTDHGRISGSQSNTLAVANGLASDAANYQVVVANAYGSLTSAVATLTMVAPPVFRAVTQTGGTMNLTWSATAGQRYQVQYKTSLSQTGWTNLAVVTATNSTAGVSDTLNTSAQRFYRTLWLP